MTATKLAIRLGVEGGAEVKRTLEETGRTGETAFRQVGAAADQATAATDRLTEKARQAGQAAQAVRPPAAPPAPPSAPPVTPSPAALREAERVRYRLDTDARNTIQLERDTAAIARAEASGVYTAAYATHLRDLSAKKYGTGNDNKAGLDPNLRQGLTYQGFDVFTTLYGGMSPALVAAQQGPQVAQTLMAGDGIKNNLAAIGRSALGLITPFSVATTAVAGLGAAFIVAASQAGSGRAELERAQQGIGRATGATVGDLEMLARANTGAGRISTGTAREITATYAGTGAIALPTVDRLTRSTADFARLTGSDIPTATAQLVAMFTDPVKGADQLAKAIGGLDDKTRQLIVTQAEQGRTASAQALLAQSLDATLKDNTRTLTGLAAGWENATAMAAKYWDRFKTKAGQLTGSAPETAEEAAARLRVEVENANSLRAFTGRAPLEMGSRQRRELDAAELIADTQRREARAKATDEAANRASVTAGELARSLDPMGQQLRALEAQRAKLWEGLATPLARSKLGDDLPKVEAAFERVTRQIADMKRDMQEFGTTAVSNLNRAADFALKTVGYTPTGRAAAEAQRVYEDNLTSQKLALTGPSSAEIEARYRTQFDRPGANFQDLFRLSQARDAEMRAATEREGYQAVRDKELERIRREALTSEVQQGGAFARLSAEVQQQFLTAAQNPRYARIPIGIAAAITGPESRGNLDIGYSRSLGEDGRPSSAFGLGQITKGTAEDAVRRGYLPADYDRMNRGTMAEGILGVLSMKLDDNGGDINRAIMAYRGSSSETVNRDYLAKVMRGAGQMGDLSEAGQAREQDARTRALSQEREALRLTTEAGGRDRDATLARIEAMRAVSDAQGRGIVVTQEYAAQLGKEALERRSIIAAGRLVEYRENAAFERSQLGRTEAGARGAYTARSLGFDPDSERGRLVMESEGLNSSLRTTKQVASEAFTGMLSDLRRGRSLVETVMNMADRMGDRFLNLASDKIISGLFSGEGKDGGGWITSMLSAVSGGAANGRVPAYADGKPPSVSAAGIISGPGGPRDDSILALVSNREAIIRASSVERYGVDFIKAINEGTAPREVALMGRNGFRVGSASRFADGTVPMVPTRDDGFTVPRRGAFGPSASAPPAITFITPPGMALEPDGPPQRRADGGYDQVLRTVESGLGQRMARGQGPFKGMPGGAAYRQG